MSGISHMELYEHLDRTFGKENAKILTNYIGFEIKDKFDHHMNTLATKEDLAKLETRIEAKIGAYKNDIIRWIFAFWVTVILMFVSLYLKP